MSGPWLDIIGIGEDGLAGLSPAARSLVSCAEIIIGGDRHHKLANDVKGMRVAWPSPFDAMIETIRSFRGQRVVVLVTGDPLWFSVGARILKSIPAHEIAFHPQVSAFQWAACRMGWSLADLSTVTVHGRAPEQIVPYFAPGERLLVLTKDKTSPMAIGQLLHDRGYGNSMLTVLAALGGPDERRIEMSAKSAHDNVPDFHTLAVECVGEPDALIYPRVGMPDDAFAHDGKMTKQAVRALALAKLVPMRKKVLWDIGCGCGSVAIEWMRGAPEAIAFGFEPRADRRALAARNAMALGTPKLTLVEGNAPECLAGFDAPDAVFIGGGVSKETIDASIAALNPMGRVVAHAVTLESEAVLLHAFSSYGGTLQRVSVETAMPVGPFHGWKPAMPVTQWFWEKR